jgi:hypothetical protein
MQSASAVDRKPLKKSGEHSYACADRAVAFLRAQHPVKTAEAVEAETRGLVSAARVQKWLLGVNKPDFAATMALICVYGPAFLSATLLVEPIWVAHATRAQHLAALEAEHARLSREIQTITRG